MAFFVDLAPFRVLSEGFPGLFGGFAAGEGDQVHELASLAVFFVERGPEADQLGAVFFQEAQVWSRNRLWRSSSLPSLR